MKEARQSPLHIEDIRKSYGSKQVLGGISFALQPGESFGLIGLNGVGKTTLIKIILQLVQAENGHVSLFGDSHRQPAARRHLSYLPEKFQPSRYLKGMEFLEFAMAYYGEKLDPKQAEEEAAALDLDPARLYDKISSYSKGMGQKIGLAGAFMVQRPLLILDEPMSGLDPLARIRLKKRMQAYKEAGNTLFFSSHILSDIDEICDRIGIIHAGKLQFLGTPSEFKTQNPAKSLESAFLESLAA
jgi:ABC-2 type transport system ATP-binding protein